jgi:anti-sigma factor ChrR (cupin superfamily)
MRNPKPPPLPAREAQLVREIKEKLRAIPKGTTTSSAAVSEIETMLDELHTLVEQSRPARRRLPPWAYFAVKEIAEKLMGLFEDTCRWLLPHPVRSWI